MTTVTFRNPMHWIWVDVKGVPKPQQKEMRETFALLIGRGGSGLLRDGRTMFVLVEARLNTREQIKLVIQQTLDRLTLPRATIHFSDAWAQAVELNPFIPDASQEALEAKLMKLRIVEEVEWIPDANEVVVWTKRRLSPAQLNKVKKALS